MAAPQGKQVGTYTILEPIASGAMGAVYRAVDDAGDSVAIKRLENEGQRERFEIEARLLGGLEHPRVVRILGHLREGSDDYLVMELVDGRDLNTVIAEEGSPGLPVERALDYIVQACEAVQYVHDQQVIHRDVKPHNLVLDKSGKVVLVDFGIARTIDAEASGTRGVGTPLFMAPEVLVGEAVSARSDVFGLAATLWTLIAGKAPSYQDGTELSDRSPDVSAQLEQAIRRGLELHPERRYGSASAFASALGSELDGDEGVPLVASTADSAKRRELLEAVVRTAASVFDAAAVSLALVDPATQELVYRAAWGAGAAEIVGVRLERGRGLAGSAVESGETVVVSDCRNDERFARQIAQGTGYVPNTMVVVPLERENRVIGALSVLDRRDGGSYDQRDMERADLFGQLAALSVGANR